MIVSAPTLTVRSAFASASPWCRTMRSGRRQPYAISAHNIAMRRLAFAPQVACRASPGALAVPAPAPDERATLRHGHS